MKSKLFPLEFERKNTQAFEIQQAKFCTAVKYQVREFSLKTLQANRDLTE